MAGDASGSISSWAGGGADTTLGAIQLAYGLYQQDQNHRPDYNIPPEIAQNLSESQKYAAQTALQGLPEEQKQQYLSNLQRSTSYGLQQSASRRGGLTGVAVANEQQNQGYGNLLAQDAGARMQNQRYGFGLVQNARQTMADYKDQAFQLNQLNPYYEKTAQNNALIGAGMQNMSQGFQAGSTGGGGDYGQTGQRQQTKMFTPSNQNSGTGMYNYDPKSIEYSPTNGRYNYDGSGQYSNYV